MSWILIGLIMYAFIAGIVFTALQLQTERTARSLLAGLFWPLTIFVNLVTS